MYIPTYIHTCMYIHSAYTVYSTDLYKVGCVYFTNYTFTNRRIIQYSTAYIW